MAPVLQCPDCGTKHPLGEVPASGAFPCKGCGRVLKVPEKVAQAAARPQADPVATTRVEAPPVAPPAPPATEVLPVVETNPRFRPIPPAAMERPVDDRPRLGNVPMWMRFLLWIIAVPLGYVIVFVVARTFGWFTSSQLSDVFLANDADRFWPVVRVLPFVALVTAIIVQAGVYAIARLRGGRSR